MDTLSFAKISMCARPMHRYVGLRLQVHLDAAVRLVIMRDVPPMVDIKIAAELLIHMAQQIQIECGGQMQCVVVRRLEDLA